MARHTASMSPSGGARRTLLRAGLTVAAAGAVVAAGGAAASAEPLGGTDPAAAAQGLTQALHTATSGGLGPVKHIKLDPLAGTGVDPLTNAVGTQVADFKPVSTAAVTGPVTSGSSLSELPLVGGVTKVLPG
ncbi:hypothetical protein [Streptomyces beihaiensis]|uniref:ATP-binding protein n=1 Tax=Streptomyces beihaiensis TaxID=2984495 RepID=A0ABT3TQR7_9ACTN|nr:hypothetical protein [Streptomyces beihaiensis]MCX3059375.1 hypothetical protein [Streptomyces beihaiensis]